MKTTAKFGRFAGVVDRPRHLTLDPQPPAPDPWLKLVIAKAETIWYLFRLLIR